MLKKFSIDQVPLPEGVTIESTDWYYSTKSDLSDEALPTELASSDKFIKEINYDFLEDTVLYVKAFMNASNDKTYPTNIIVIAKHYKKMLINGFVYAPDIKTVMRNDHMGVQVSINDPIFYFYTDTWTSVSWMVKDTKGNIIFSRMHDKDNLNNITIPLPMANKYDSLVICARYEFQDTVEDVWGRELIILEKERLNVALESVVVHKGSTTKLAIVNNNYAIGNLMYSIETKSGMSLTERIYYEDGVYFTPDIISSYTMVNVVFRLSDSLYGDIHKTIPITVKGELAKFVKVLSHEPTVLIRDGLSPSVMNQLHYENNYLLEIDSSDNIDIYNLTPTTITLSKENVMYLNNYVDGFTVHYVNDDELLIGFNSDTDRVLRHVADMINLTLLNEYTIPSDTKYTVKGESVYYKDGDDIKQIDLRTGDTITHTGDFDKYRITDNVSPYKNEFFLFNKDGHMYRSSDEDTNITYSDDEVDELHVYPTDSGVNIVFGIDSQSLIKVVDYNAVTGNFTVLKTIDGLSDDYSILYDLERDEIIMMKG